ncbi:MAG: hypothetical protein ACOC9Y_04900 [Chloroflexota bacterium]
MHRVWMFIPVVLIAALVTGCSSPITGMQAPVGHDYDGIQWRPLEHIVSQAVILAPGYSAALQNDADVTPDELRDRLQELPDDVRNAEPEAIRVRLRPMKDAESYRPAPTVNVTSAIDPGDDGPPLPNANAPHLIAENALRLERRGDWLIIDAPTTARAGDVVVIQIMPDPDATATWEYGVTPDRKPYGGWFARLGAEGEVQPNLSLSYATIFVQDPDFRQMVTDSLSRVGGQLRNDLPFAVGFIALLGSIIGIGAAAYRTGEGR